MPSFDPVRRSGPGGLSPADHQSLQQAKQALRAAVRRRRAARSAEERAELDHRRFTALASFLTPHLRPSTTTACYLSAGLEPATFELVAWLAARSRVLLPVLGRGRRPITELSPAWAPYRGPERLREGRFGLPEPTSRRVDADRLGRVPVVLAPALAVTADGRRLGAGGGWYDRALAAFPDAVIVALVYDDEVFDSLPVEPWDTRVDVVATPTRLIPTAPAG